MSVSLRFPPKLPGERLQYAINWAEVFDTDETIVEAVAGIVNGTAGVTLDTTEWTDTQVTFFLSGGVSGQFNTIRCLVRTTNFQTHEVEISMWISLQAPGSLSFPPPPPPPDNVIDLDVTTADTTLFTADNAVVRDLFATINTRLAALDA